MVAKDKLDKFNKFDLRSPIGDKTMFRDGERVHTGASSSLMTVRMWSGNIFSRVTIKVSISELRAILIKLHCTA